eukprot:6855316-Prymnesium_polylepis.1
MARAAARTSAVGHAVCAWHCAAAIGQDATLTAAVGVERQVLRRHSALAKPAERPVTRAWAAAGPGRSGRRPGMWGVRARVRVSVQGEGQDQAEGSG